MTESDRFGTTQENSRLIHQKGEAMTTSALPFVECDQIHACLVVSDIPAAVDFYTKKLGFKLGFTWGGDPPTFAGVNLGRVQMFLQKGTPNPKGCSVSFLVGDADQLCEFH